MHELPASIAQDIPANSGSATRQIEGWTVHISNRLLTLEAAATDRALDLLTAQLQEITHVVPEVALTELRKVPLWLSPEYPNVPPRAEYHPGASWLKANGRDPEMEKGVEYTNIRIFERETARMPNFTLHELAHAYHDRSLANGFDNADIRAAFENAKKQSLYERVEQRFGDGRSSVVRAYAITNPQEYFAECSEAFFSTNDFFPFTSDELERHDPVMFNLLSSLWGVIQQPQTDASDQLGNTGPRVNTTADLYKEWKHSGVFWLITTPEGANLPDNARVTDFPILLCLHSEFFDFTLAQSDASDLRFSSDSGQPLEYQIETWDAAIGIANVWVRIPQIIGNTRQPVHMHWGNPQASSESDGAAVFNEANGFLSVWHMDDPVSDSVGKLTINDSGTTSVKGRIGPSRSFSEGTGLFGGDKITGFPTGSNAHTTEAWFRTLQPNTTLIAWGNEEAQGKVVMQLRSPPHIRMDCYFSEGNVASDSPLRLGDWTHVAHTYQKGESLLYINGAIDGSNRDPRSPLNLRSPARLWIGGWYHHYNYIGDLDEVRVSNTVRSPDWIKLQYENQKPNQTLVGPVVQQGNQFAVSDTLLSIDEDQQQTITTKADGAQKLLWTLKRDGIESVVSTDRLSYVFNAGRVDTDQTLTLIFQAVYPDNNQSKEIEIHVKNTIPDPIFTLTAPSTWDGRTTIEVEPQIANLAELQSHNAAALNIEWSTDDIAVIKQDLAEKLILQRAQGNGQLSVSASIDNGGKRIKQTILIDVNQPPTASESWLDRTYDVHEQPQDNQFIPCDGIGPLGKRHGTLVYSGTLEENVDSVFLRVFADEQLLVNQQATLNNERAYTLTAPLTAGLIKYRTEFGSRSNNRETIRHTATNILCGDVYVITGQSNAVATDFGNENNLQPNEWIRTFGTTSSDTNRDPHGPWTDAVARGDGGRAAIGYWGMELARRLVESEGIPICILNGAVGGTRIDQHQRNENDPTDVHSIYGRLLWRAQQAKLTHGVRAIIWHQGENDQGADGPTGGYGYETYRQLFTELSASWKQDFPNIQQYYVFQIWPKSCAMGIDGSDNKLREVQRTLPTLFSNLTVMSTVGIKPPGECHFPAEGYADFARLLTPLFQKDLYQRTFDRPITAPNLLRAYFSNLQRDELILEFDQPVVWRDELVTDFRLDDSTVEILSGAVSGKQCKLTLKTSSSAKTVTYLDSSNWDVNRLLYGANGIAALTFCDVAIEAPN